MKKSIKINATLNVIKTIILVIFPLITFPYATRTLGTENIGKVQFGNSIISYILLLSSLGISMYAIREGTAYRNDREKMSKFASQMFSINLLFTIISYAILLITLIFPTKLQNYTVLLLIQSITVIFTTLGVEWIYTIYEDYLYITIRSIVTHIISLVLLFVLVHNQADYYYYAIVSVIATSSSYLFNFIHAKKYCDIKITFKTNLKKHFKALIILFSNNVATQIYINSDVTMLGLLLNDYYVGIYGVSTKVYFMLKNILNAIVTVVIPRLSFYKNNGNHKEYNALCSDIINACIVLIFPTILGLVLLSDEIVYLLAGAEFIEASTSLKILSFSLLFAVFANFFANAVLIVNKLEKYVLKATIFAAVINILLNFICIPIFKHNGVALTTLISEFTVACLTYYHAKREIEIEGFKSNLITCLLGLVTIVMVWMMIEMTGFSITISLILTVILSVIAYFLALIVLKNKIVLKLLNQIKKKKKNIFS